MCSSETKKLHLSLFCRRIGRRLHILWITTSEKTNLVVNRAGVLAENLVVDSSTNKVGVSVNVKFSDTSSVDLSILKELPTCQRLPRYQHSFQE